MRADRAERHDARCAFLPGAPQQEFEFAYLVAAVTCARQVVALDGNMTPPGRDHERVAFHGRRQAGEREPVDAMREPRITIEQ